MFALYIEDFLNCTLVCHLPKQSLIKVVAL